MKKKTTLAWSARPASFLSLIAMAIFMAGCGADPDSKGDDEGCAAGHTLVEAECVPNTAGCEPGFVREGEECIPLPTVCGDADSDRGDGSDSSPYILCDRADLEGIVNDINAYYALGANIDLSGAEWEPIESFAGRLDGRGFEISGLKITLTPEGDANHWGLFRALVQPSVIENLTLSSAQLTISDGNRVGALAGFNEGRIVRVHLRDARVRGESNVGGLIGKDERGVLQQLTGERLNVSGRLTIGGLIGWAAASTMSELKVNEVEVEASDQKAGGVIGSMGGADSRSSTLTDASASEVRISSPGNLVAGIVGEMADASDSQKLRLKGALIIGAANIGGATGRLNGGSAIVDVNVSGTEIKGSASGLGGVAGYVDEASSITKVDVSELEIVGAANRIGAVAGRALNNAALGDISASKIVITGAERHIGGIIGQLQNDSTLTDATILEAEIKGGGESVGGAIGECIACTIERVFIRDSAVEGAYRWTGGIAGHATNRSTIADVHAAEIEVLAISTATTSEAKPVGGIVGRLHQSALERASTYEVHVELRGVGRDVGGIAGNINNDAQARDVSAHGTVQGVDVVGGLCGYIGNSTLERGYSLAVILGDDGEPLGLDEGTEVGPVVGNKGAGGNLIGLFFWHEATAVRNDEGVPLGRADLADEGKFPGWNFAEVWEIRIDDGGFERPLLRSIP